MDRAPRSAIGPRGSIVVGLVVLAGFAAGCAGPASDSDARAIEIADATLVSMGGRDGWDRTRFIAWNFLGRRYHLWDKGGGRARVEFRSLTATEPVVAVLDLATGEGRVWLAGEPVTEPEPLAAHLERATDAWHNDSYWLFMPFKLRDPGVTLKYAGKGEMEAGGSADVLDVTFTDVGLTPRNRYRVYVSEATGLVEQWDVYGDRDEPEPRFRTPWTDWERYGSILLSSGRGDRRILDIAVYDEVPPERFESPIPIGLDVSTPEAGQP